MIWWQRLWRRHELEQQLDAELRDHLERQVTDYVQAGLSEADARRSARLAFGGLDQVKEQCRDVRGTRWLEEVLQDARYGVRLLAKSPGFTVIAVLTLALGIGATTAMFTVVNAVLLRPLPYHNPDRLVAVYETLPDFPRFFVNPSNFVEYQQHNTVFESVAAHVRSNLILTGGGEPLAVRSVRVSANLFTLLGVAPIHGRTFDPEEDHPGNDDVMIVSHGFWQQHFGADPGVIGQQLVLSDRTFTIVGVMPSGFELPGLFQGVDAWRPWARSATASRCRAQGTNRRPSRCRPTAARRTFHSARV